MEDTAANTLDTRRWLGRKVSSRRISRHQQLDRRPALEYDEERLRQIDEDSSM